MVRLVPGSTAVFLVERPNSVTNYFGLAKALDLDESGTLAPPATGRSTFIFDVRPHGAYPTTVTHRSGQVEIDTLFAERRNGQLTLFVIEAKTGPRDSLVKHKLVYPLLAVADDVPDHVELVPVYLRCWQADDRFTFDVAECSFPDPRESNEDLTHPAVDDLTVARTRVIELEL